MNPEQLAIAIPIIYAGLFSGFILLGLWLGGVVFVNKLGRAPYGSVRAAFTTALAVLISYTIGQNRVWESVQFPFRNSYEWMWPGISVAALLAAGTVRLHWLIRVALLSITIAGALALMLSPMLGREGYNFLPAIATWIAGTILAVGLIRPALIVGHQLLFDGLLILLMSTIALIIGLSASASFATITGILTAVVFPVVYYHLFPEEWRGAVRSVLVSAAIMGMCCILVAGTEFNAVPDDTAYYLLGGWAVTGIMGWIASSRRVPLAVVLGCILLVMALYGWIIWGVYAQWVLDSGDYPLY